MWILHSCHLDIENIFFSFFCSSLSCIWKIQKWVYNFRRFATCSSQHLKFGPFLWCLLDSLWLSHKFVVTWYLKLHQFWLDSVVPKVTFVEGKIPFPTRLCKYGTLCLCSWESGALPTFPFTPLCVSFKTKEHLPTMSTTKWCIRTCLQRELF